VYEKISAEREHFPIQKKMDEFSRRLGAITLLGVAVLSLFGVFLLSYTPTEILKIAVAQAVSFVPEGLPIVVTIALALSVFEMAKKNALTRKLQAIETIGIVGVICVDKTGTLTQNRMRVQRVFLDFADFEIGESGKVACEGKPADLLEQPHFVELLKTGVLCNDAVDGDSSKHHEPVETALLEFALPFGYEKKKLEAMRQRTGEVPFDPKNKYMITMNRKDEKTHFNLKGAPEVVLSMCSKILKRGKAHPITPKHKKIILATTEKYAREGLRVMAFAYKNAERSKTIDNDYQFAGLVAFQDPLRAEAKAAVQKAREAGIRVIMITGDHCLTAQTIAREAGILLERGTVITGEEMERMGEKTLLRELARVQVFARVTSEHKLKIIELLKKRGEIVAMTGDGVNDALALKKADVGVALGSGTEVAKEASDIVLLDDNFSSLVDAVEEGRHSAMNIRRVVKYLFSTNFTEVLFLFIIIFSPVLFGTYLPLALLPIHILYVNLVTDGLCDVTLATEKKSENLMNKPPSYFKGGAFFSPDVMKFILATSLVSFTLLIFTYFYYLEHASSIGHMRTVVFTLLSFMQLWSAINARTASKSVFEAGFFSNRYLVGGIAVSIVVQLAAIYHPFFNEVLKTVPLTLFDWAVVLAGSTSLFMLFEIIKYFERRGMSIIS
ncbi:ATPase, partial [Candidatus Micrarchaeota archaeon CG11_big_fil_rev_8_21_14_0_20_47_5]